MNLDYLTLIYGTDSFDLNLFGTGLIDLKKDDFIVPVKDEISIFDGILTSNSSNRVLKSVFKKHLDMPNDKETWDTVKKSLSKSIYRGGG